MLRLPTPAFLMQRLTRLPFPERGPSLFRVRFATPARHSAHLAPLVRTLPLLVRRQPIARLQPRWSMSDRGGPALLRVVGLRLGVIGAKESEASADGRGELRTPGFPVLGGTGGELT